MHCSVMRDGGFWDWMVARRSGDLSSEFRYPPVRDGPPASVRALSAVDYSEGADEAYVCAPVDECLPEDRSRYLVCLRRRNLDLGLVTAVFYDW